MSVTTASAVRIRPVPRSEPLTDDELLSTTDRTLPPDLATGVRVRGGLRPSPAGLPAVMATALHTPPQAGQGSVVTPGLAAASDREQDRGRDSDGEGDRGGHSAGHEPTPGSREARLAARRLLGACIEVIGGFRPVSQLRPYCAPERFDAIVNRLLRPVGTGRGHGATRASVVARTLGPPKVGRPGLPSPQDRVTVRRVQLCDVRDGVLELAVVMARRGKVWAMAMRMERSRGRWQCMHLEVL